MDWKSPKGAGCLPWCLDCAIGSLYRQELAVGVRALGYDIVPGKDSLFEIAGVSPDAIRAFSERAAQVEARLAERGQTRETASAEEKQIAALDKATNLIDQKSFYVSISPARESVAIYTNDRAKLVTAINERAGLAQAAVSEAAMAAPAARKSLGAGWG